MAWPWSILTERREWGALMSFYGHTSSDQDPMLMSHLTLITCLLQMQPHWSLGLQHVNLKEENTLSPQPPGSNAFLPLVDTDKKEDGPYSQSLKMREGSLLGNARFQSWPCHLPALRPCAEHMLSLLCGSATM